MLDVNQSLDAAPSASASTLGGVLSYFPSSQLMRVLHIDWAQRSPKKKKKPQKTFSVANFSEYSPPVEADLSLENVVEKNKFLKLGTRQ